MSLGTLAADTVIDAVLASVDQSMFVISTDLTATLRGLTAGEGPISAGINSNALSPAQVVEALTASPLSQSDRIAQERVGRPVRLIGTFDGQNASEALNDGMMIRTRVKFNISQAQDLNFWAKNDSGATLTTGGILHVKGKIYINWT